MTRGEDWWDRVCPAVAWGRCTVTQRWEKKTSGEELAQEQQWGCGMRLHRLAGQDS